MTREEAIEIIKCGDIYNRWGKDGEEVEKMAIEALEQIEKIKSIINDPFYFRGMPVYFEHDVLRYKAICEVLGCKTV